MESNFLSPVGMKQKMSLTWLDDIEKNQVHVVVFETEVKERLKERDQSSQSIHNDKTISVVSALLEYYWHSTACTERKQSGR